MQRRPGYPSVTVYPPHAGHEQQGHHFGTQQPQMQPCPVMPSMGGVARAARLVSTLVSQTVVLTVIVVLAELFVPDAYKPSTMLGKFSGHHEAVELETKQAATVDFQKAIQLVTAELQRTTTAYETLFQRSNAITQQAYQMEAIVLQMQQQIVAQGMGVQTFGSEIADLACLVSPFLQGTEYAELNQACGVGRAIRQGQAEELALTARDNSAIVPRNVFRDLPDPASNYVQAGEALRQFYETIKPALDPVPVSHPMS
jgi:hypothetical protein